MSNEPSDMDRALAEIPDDDVLVLRNEAGAVAELNRSELETQLDAAHRYPRSTKKFLQKAISLATLTQEIAESCIYTLPRGKKPITGPSVRLAEICAATYQNLHVGARPLDVMAKEVVSQGVAWDLETNYRVTIEAKRRITGSGGGRYNEDMIQVTHAAATAIAFRNSVFKVIPRSQIDYIYAEVRRVAVGDAKTLDAKRADLMNRFGKMGVTVDRVLAAVDRKAVEDVGLDDIEVLIGLGTAVKNGDQSIDVAFPAPTAGAATADAPKEGKRAPLRRPDKKEAEAAAKPAPAPTPASDRGDDPMLDGTSGHPKKQTEIEERAPWDK